jgi:hypothetical protein
MLLPFDILLVSLVAFLLVKLDHELLNLIVFPLRIKSTHKGTSPISLYSAIFLALGS